MLLLTAYLQFGRRISPSIQITCPLSIVPQESSLVVMFSGHRVWEGENLWM